MCLLSAVSGQLFADYNTFHDIIRARTAQASG